MGVASYYFLRYLLRPLKHSKFKVNILNRAHCVDGTLTSFSPPGPEVRGSDWLSEISVLARLKEGWPGVVMWCTGRSLICWSVKTTSSYQTADCWLNIPCLRVYWCQIWVPSHHNIKGRGGGTERPTIICKKLSSDGLDWRAGLVDKNNGDVRDTRGSQSTIQQYPHFRLHWPFIFSWC